MRGAPSVFLAGLTACVKQGDPLGKIFSLGGRPPPAEGDSPLNRGGS